MPHLPQPARNHGFAAMRVVRRASESRPPARPAISVGAVPEKYELYAAAVISEIKRLTEPREA